MEQMTLEQKEAIAKFLMTMAADVAQTPPSLNPDFEKIQDMSKNMIGGIRLAVTILFGKEASEDIFTAVNAALIAQLGYEPNLTPSLFLTAADTGVMKDWLYQDRTWRPPSQ